MKIVTVKNNVCKGRLFFNKGILWNRVPTQRGSRMCPWSKWPQLTCVWHASELLTPQDNKLYTLFMNTKVDRERNGYNLSEYSLQGKPLYVLTLTFCIWICRISFYIFYCSGRFKYDLWERNPFDKKPLMKLRTDYRIARGYVGIFYTNTRISLKYKNCFYVGAPVKQIYAYSWFIKVSWFVSKVEYN